ncbi:regulatory protein RecX [Ignatzschineria sp. LJL83]
MEDDREFKETFTLEESFQDDHQDHQQISESDSLLEVDEANFDTILSDAEAEAAERKLWRYWRERAMNFLVRREHSEVELRQKLTQRECPAWLVDDIIEWLYEQNYLSLERFAYSYSKNRASLGYGPIRIRHELASMHQLSNREIQEAFSEVNWQEAKNTAERKIKQTDPYKYKAALYRRGFLEDEE